MRFLDATAVLGGLAQITTTPDLNPLAGYGILGVLLAFVLWLFIDERKQHRILRDKVISDVIPALIGSTEQMKENAAAVVMMHQLASRPNIDPVAFSQWVRLLEDVREQLSIQRGRRSGSD